jgi:putative hydrolases of HD superfamily
MERLERQLSFLVEIDRLKEILRRNLTTQSRRQENSAEHSWHLALCALMLAEHADDGGRPLDVVRAMKMVLIHDIVEIDAGDCFIYDAAATAGQEEREQAAATRIFGLLPEDQALELRALWDEFEAAATPEAKFAKAMDRLQPVLLNLNSGGGSWRRHGVKLDQVRRINGRIADSSPALWDWCERELAKAVARGDLQA